MKAYWKMKMKLLEYKDWKEKRKCKSTNLDQCKFRKNKKEAIWKTVQT